MTCPNSVVSTGITLTVGNAANYFVRNSSSGCNLITPSGGATCVIAPSNLASVSPGSNGFTLTPEVAGTGTATFGAPGFASVTVPLTVNAGVLDVTSS